MGAPAPTGSDKWTQPFVDIFALAADPAYEEAAARSGPPPTGRDDRRARRPAVALVGACVAGLGLVLGMAAAQTSRRAPDAARLRRALLAQIDDGVRRTDELQRATDRLRRDVATARDAQLAATGEGAQLASRVRALELAGGQLPVRGPGVVVTIGDPPDADADERVTDRDLQVVVNALWAAGADAVSVGEQRIGPLSAVREAGGVVLVDFHPVSSPYRVAAIGDPDVLEPAFAASTAAGRLHALESAYGVVVGVERAQELTLRAAGTSALRVAQPVEPEGPR